MAADVEGEVRLTERFGDALVYANTAHAEQVRKGSGIPYVAHLLAVAALVLEHGGNEDEAVAAVLHDVIEDQGQHHEDAIRDRFGAPVASVVRECSAEEKDGSSWKERKQRYLDHLEVATPSAVLVSLCDKLHNARSILADHRALGNRLWSRFNAPEPDQRWYYRSLLEVYRRRAAGDPRIRPLVDELSRTTGQLWP